MSPERTLQRLRSLLLGLVLLGAVGLLVELALLEHWEVGTQRLPLVLLLLTVAGALASLLRPGPRVLTAFRAALALVVVSGLVGTVFHFRSNAQLEMELAPDRPTGQIIRAALGGGTPTLAPGAMVQLGLLGLLALYRHPGRRADDA